MATGSSAAGPAVPRGERRDGSVTHGRHTRMETSPLSDIYYGHANDREGIVDVRCGDCIRDRCTFGTVLTVWDAKHREEVALKMVRAVRRYSESARVERDILLHIREADPDRKSGCVRLYGSFSVKWRDQRHECIVFEKLGCSLYTFSKRNHYRGFRLVDVQAFARQIINAVAFCHSIKLVHTDLKPENILLERDDYVVLPASERDGVADYRVPVSNRVRLIDFGGAVFEDQHHSSIINTRQYRSPEVLLGLPWSYPSDLWSVGCILVELATGELLFQTHDDLEHLALIEKAVGRKLPTHMTLKALQPFEELRSRRERERERSRRSHSDSPDCSRRARSGSRRRNDEHRRRRTPSSSSSGGRSSSRARPDKLLRRDGTLRFPEKAHRSSVSHVAKSKTLEEIVQHPSLLDLLRQLLVLEPEGRITAAAALRHPFLHEDLTAQRNR